MFFIAMKLLAFVDIHGSLKAIKKIAEKAKKSKPDLLVCAGALTKFEQGLDYLLYRLDKIGQQINSSFFFLINYFIF